MLTFLFQYIRDSTMKIIADSVLKKQMEVWLADINEENEDMTCRHKWKNLANHSLEIFKTFYYFCISLDFREVIVSIAKKE